MLPTFFNILISLQIIKLNQTRNCPTIHVSANRYGICLPLREDSNRLYSAPFFPGEMTGLWFKASHGLGRLRSRFDRLISDFIINKREHCARSKIENQNFIYQLGLRMLLGPNGYSFLKAKDVEVPQRISVHYFCISLRLKQTMR